MFVYTFVPSINKHPFRISGSKAVQNGQTISLFLGNLIFQTLWRNLLNLNTVYYQYKSNKWNIVNIKMLCLCRITNNWLHIWLYILFCKIFGLVSKFWNFILKFAVSFDVWIRHFNTHKQMVISWNIHPSFLIRMFANINYLWKWYA